MLSWFKIQIGSGEHKLLKTDWQVRFEVNFSWPLKLLFGNIPNPIDGLQSYSVSFFSTFYAKNRYLETHCSWLYLGSRKIPPLIKSGSSFGQKFSLKTNLWTKIKEFFFCLHFQLMFKEGLSLGRFCSARYVKNIVLQHLLHKHWFDGD